MSGNIKGLLGYYRDCFKEDSADFNLRNLQKLSSEDLLLLKGEDEIASGNLHRLPIRPDFGESFAKRIEIYLRERVLLHCSLFVAGKLTHESGVVTLFSPLVVCEAKIESDEYGYYFRSEQAAVNEELLSLLLPDENSFPEIDNSRIYDPSYWVTVLEKSPFEIRCLDALRFPELVSAEEATKAARRKTLSLLSLSALAFIERSASSRGVLHELSTIIGKDNVSEPLHALLSDSEHQDNGSAPSVNHRFVPALLSASQKRVLDIAASNTLGVVSGPPGTGKSYTIAAIAAEHFTRRQSVLIVANSETALDVIADKLSRDFDLDNLFVRAGQKAVLKQFKQYLEGLLSGYYEHSDAKHSKTYQSQLVDIVRDIEGYENQLQRLCFSAIKQGERSHKVALGVAGFWDKLLYKVSALSIERTSKMWDIQKRFNNLLQDKEIQSSKYLRAEKAKIISELLKTDRKSVQTLNKASRARTSAKQTEYFSSINFDNLLTGFPVWLVSLNTLHKVLPLEKEMFDLVIIDEATQCNISSTLPALERGKRALVVGDQKQLTHFSFLAKAKEQQLAAENGVSGLDKAISYRDNSIIDLALQSVTQQDQVAFLDEHFRSQPELINFSNQHFYANKLKVMQHRPCSTSGHVQVTQVNGERSSSGVNVKEAEAILAKLQEIIEDNRQNGIFKSLGVLSPFSKQAQYLSDLVENHLALDDIKNHHVRVATPYGFQGEERDIMLISFAIDNNSLRAAAYLNKPDVFNVSMTRARQLQLVYTSVDENTLPVNNLLRRYLTSVGQFIVDHKAEQQPDDFQCEVAQYLETNGFEFWRGYEMLGTYIDILARKNGKYVAIDLIGYPGPWRDYFELDTYKIIKRAGLDVFPLSYALWVKNKTLCVDSLVSLFE